MSIRRQITEAKGTLAPPDRRAFRPMKIDGLQTDLSDFPIYAEKESDNHDLKELAGGHEAQLDNL
jgi:hypothetical protein